MNDEIARSRSTSRQDERSPGPTRAQFMACGYVAPILSEQQGDHAEAAGSDAGFDRMLKALRQRIRRLVGEE